jgi:nucleotide-binding universal stress UspA family protein
MTATSGIHRQCPPRAVLAGVDFGEASARAIAVAGFVAAGVGARLQVLHAERFEPPAYFTLEQIARLEAERQAAQQAAMAHLAEFARALTQHPVEARVVDLPPVDALLDAAHAADLLVVGTHGRRGPGRWWLGSVAERVVRAAPCHVLVTRAASTPPRDVFERLLVVQDGTDADATTRSCAGHLAALANGRVESSSFAACETGAAQRASLVVMTTPAEQPSSWGFADAVARVLGGCDRPVLFVKAH